MSNKAVNEGCVDIWRQWHGEDGAGTHFTQVYGAEVSDKLRGRLSKRYVFQRVVVDWNEGYIHRGLQGEGIGQIFIKRDSPFHPVKYNGWISDHSRREGFTLVRVLSRDDHHKYVRSVLSFGIVSI